MCILPLLSQLYIIHAYIKICCFIIMRVIKIIYIIYLDINCLSNSGVVPIKAFRFRNVVFPVIYYCIDLPSSKSSHYDYGDI